MKIEQIIINDTVIRNTPPANIGICIQKINELIDIIHEQQDRIEELENKAKQILPDLS